jgi:D-tyrosyl-tRNA(Tyr) deacylase
MRAVVQRVSRAEIKIEKKTKASMESGLLVLLACGRGDSKQQADWMATKITNLRIFEDTEQRMNLSVKDMEGQMIVVSQFTLYGDCRKGKRPSFARAQEPSAASALIEYFVERIRSLGIHCQTGEFGACMQVESINDGPVTLLIDSNHARRDTNPTF